MFANGSEYDAVVRRDYTIRIGGEGFDGHKYFSDMHCFQKDIEIWSIEMNHFQGHRRYIIQSYYPDPSKRHGLGRNATLHIDEEALIHWFGEEGVRYFRDKFGCREETP